MPTNLPPQYFEAEKRYKEAKDPAEKVERLEELIGTIPKHKGTDHLRADLRRKLSKLKTAAQPRRKGARRDPAWTIPREGAGRAVLIGCSNAGKSALLAALTNAEPEVSQAPFTSWTPTPGMMLVENVQIQLIDTPSIDRDYLEPVLMDLVRSADLILLVVDLDADPNQQLERTLDLLAEQRIHPLRWKERFNDGARRNFLPVLVVANKGDDASDDESFQIFRRLLDEDWNSIAVSARSGRELEQLRRVVFERLEIMRIYSRAPGREPDLNTPFVLHKGSTVQEFADQLHHDFYNKLRSARVWGKGVYDGQLVAREHVLHDGDVVELRI
ncbi:MAG: GTPase [Anaerolineales bacterium]